MLLALHKPYGMLSQFTPEPGSSWACLGDLGLPKRIYPLGRLDADSEGLLLLSDEPGLNHQLLDPRHAHARTYWAQVEGLPESSALASLRCGVVIQGQRTRPALAQLLDPAPDIAARNPPIRRRLSVPDAWIELALTEGRNRQVRRMTAAVGHPTLRLIRVRIGTLGLGDLHPGQWRELGPTERAQIFNR